MSFELLDGIRTNGQRNPKAALDQKHGHHTTKEINILVLGMRGAGKTGKYLCPPSEGLEDILFLVWIPSASASALASASA